MSIETSTWAKQQRCGDPVTKAVLMEIANWARPDGVCEFLPVQRIADVVEVSARTVQRHIARLEDNDLDNGGLGMLRRVIRYREDGGQGSNGFELIGYEPSSATAQRDPKTTFSPPVNLSPPPRQFVTGPGDTAVTRLGDKIIPLSISSEIDISADDFSENEKQDEADPVALEPAHVVEAWNELAERIGLATIRKLSASRTLKLKARLREYTVDEWREALAAIERSSFLRGDNNRGWRADFDFLLQPSTFIKLIEGCYDTANK